MILGKCKFLSRYYATNIMLPMVCTSFFIKRMKRSTADDLNSILNEIATEEELRNVPNIDKEKLQNYALLQYLLLHKPSMFKAFFLGILIYSIFS